MSLVVSSTTDSQEAVNAAAGLEAGAAPAPAESTAPSPAEEPPPQPDKPEEPKEPEEKPESEETGEPEAPRKKGGFQRKIERLEYISEQQAEYARQQAEYVRHLEAQLAAQRPGEPPKPQAQTAPPKEEDFASYPEYIRAAARWEARQELLEQQEVARRAAAEWQQRQQQEAYEQKAVAFARSVDDYAETLNSVRHIRFAEDVADAIKDSEIGPQLAYELARQPEELMRLAKLPVRSAIREIGKFEAQLLSRSTNGSTRAPVAPSKAPPPISPVGGGGPLTTKDPGEMSLAEYKAWWRKTHPGRKY